MPQGTVLQSHRVRVDGSKREVGGVCGGEEGVRGGGGGEGVPVNMEEAAKYFQLHTALEEQSLEQREEGGQEEKTQQLPGTDKAR